MLDLITHEKNFTFHIKPTDNLQKVVLTEVTYLDYDKRELGKKAVSTNNNRTLVQSLQRQFNKTNVSRCGVVYVRACLTFCFESNDNEIHGRKIRVKLTYPNQCDIPDCPDEQRQTIDAYLKRLNLTDKTSDNDAPTNVFTCNASKLAIDICESSSNRIAHTILSMLGSAGKTLLSLNAFSEGFKSEYPNIYAEECLMELERRKQNWGYYDKHHNWIEVSDDETIEYQLDLNWLINQIRCDLEMPTNSPPNVLVPDCLWYLGKVALSHQLEVPLFFARCLSEPSRWQACCATLQAHAGFKKGLVLTSSEIQLQGYSLLGEHLVVSLDQCQAYGSEQFHLERDYLHTRYNSKSSPYATTEEPAFFSEDYRYVKSKHGEDEFTINEAAIVRELHRRKGKVHKSVLLRAVNSSQTDVNEIFRHAGKYNKALKRLIKFKNGFYRLDY